MPAQVSIFFRPYQLPPGAPLSACFDIARAMDEAGIHSICFGDHLLLGAHPEAYPYGPFAHPKDSAWPEPLVTLAGMAAVTRRLRLATGVLLAPLRPPLLLARMIATLDALSNGRTQLAVGVGWQKEEYEALHVPWAERYRRLDEAVRACRAAWGEQPVTYRDENIVLDAAWMLPRPAQARVPILYGLAMTERNARRMAELGDGWFPVGLEPPQIRDGVDRLAEALAAAGRHLSDQHIRAGIDRRDGAGALDLARTFEAAPDYLAAGATILQVSAPPAPETMAELFRFIEAVGRRSEALG